MWRIVRPRRFLSSNRGPGASSSSHRATSTTLQPSLSLYIINRMTYAAAAPATPPPPPTLERIWELWSEGNLFSLSVVNLQSFLTAQGVTVDPEWKKTALVKQVEELINSDTEKQKAGGSVSRTLGGKKSADAVAVPAPHVELLSLDSVFETVSGGQDEEFVDIQQTGLYTSETMGPVIPRAFQLMHAEVCPDVLISRLNTTAFPGGNAGSVSYTFVPMTAKNSNRARFQKAFQWCLVNLWNLNMDGEMHCSFGKMLLWSPSSHTNTPRQRNQRTLWAAQQELQGTEQPYSWLTLAHTSTEPDISEHCQKNGYEKNPHETTLYRASIKRQKDFLEAEFDESLSTTSISHSWERLLVSYYIRPTMPDGRMQVRARAAPKKKVVEPFQGIPLLKFSSSKKKGAEEIVQCVPPELGEITYAIRKDIKQWSRNTSANVPLTVTCSATTVVLSSAQHKHAEGHVNEEPRIEIEMSCPIPQQHAKMDSTTFCDEIWSEMMNITEAMNTSMQHFGCEAIVKK